MARVRFGAVDDAVAVITSSIPGAQEGESVAEFQARVNERLIEIVAAVGKHKEKVDAFIREHSDEDVEPTDQFFNAVRQRFIGDEFGSE